MVLSCSDLCSRLLLLEQILEVQRPIPREVFLKSLHIKMPLSSECLGVNILYLKLVSFSLRGSYPFVPRLSDSTANFCIQTKGVDCWATYSFFGITSLFWWDMTLLGSPQTPLLGSPQTPVTRSAADWHPAHPSQPPKGWSWQVSVTTPCYSSVGFELFMLLFSQSYLVP